LPGYTLRDLVTDAVGVLDGLGIARAHLAGLATGGFIAQLVAWTTRRGWPRSS
jgi:pimeloyl-ACP methyl ester carboxylesterase